MSDHLLATGAIITGGLMSWFGIHYWRDTKTLYPGTVVQSVLQGKGLPARAEQTSRVASTVSQLTADQTAGATDSGGGSGSGSGSAGSPSTATSGADSANAVTIAKYLMANGYTANGAGGVLADIYGESGFDPEAVGAGSYGLIQWQGSEYSDLVTGDATADLDKQLPEIIAYNNAQGAGLVSELNAQTSISEAADFYSQNFERPAVTDSDVSAAGIAAATTAVQAAQ